MRQQSWERTSGLQSSTSVLSPDDSRTCLQRRPKTEMNVIEVVQAFDRAPITALKTDDASALESKLSAAARLFADRKSWLKPFERIAILHRLSVLPHIVFRTPFGKLRLESPRFYHCQCESDDRTSFSPLAELLQERTHPELVYLETKFAALVSYGLTVELLKEVLPISQDLSTTAIRRRVRQMAQRLEDELGEEQDIFIDG